MKIAVVFALFASILLSAYGESMEEIETIVSAAYKICEVYAPLSPNALADYLEDENPKDMSLPERIYCMHLGLGFQNANGTFNAKRTDDLTEVVAGHSENDAIDACAKEVEGIDAPSNTAKFVKCTQSKIDKDTYARICKVYYKLDI